MEIIDTHAHLYESIFDEDIDELFNKFQQVGIKKVLLPCTNIFDVERMIHIKNRYPDVCDIMLGVHPEEIEVDYFAQLCHLEKIIKEQPFVGVGEIGLDYKCSNVAHDIQKYFFEYELTISQQMSLPVSIHCREAFEDMYNILKHYKNSISGVIHCFTGTVEQAQKYIGLGFYLGIGGVVTFKNSILKHVLKHVSIENIVLETDSPFLTPVPYRGQRNDPTKLINVIQALSEVYNISPSDVAQNTTNNAVKIFRL